MRDEPARGYKLKEATIPWSAADASKKTHKADTSKAKRQWAHVANAELAKTGDDARAIRAANSVVRKRKLRARMQGTD